MTFSNPALRHEGFGDIANHHLNVILIVVAMVIGTAIAVPAARLVKMTAMPQMVAIFNGVGGGAAALVSVTELLEIPGIGGGGLQDRRGALGVHRRLGVVLRERDRVREVAGDHDRPPAHLSRASSGERAARRS